MAQFVEALRYNPEKRGFDSLWVHGSWQSFRPHYGSVFDSASNRSESKDSQCVGLTTLCHLHVPVVPKQSHCIYVYINVVQTVLFYSCTDDMNFITQILKLIINCIYSLRVSPLPPPEWKILGARLPQRARLWSGRLTASLECMWRRKASFNTCYLFILTLTLLTWTIWRAPTNASKWRMGFNPYPVNVDNMASSYQC